MSLVSNTFLLFTAAAVLLYYLAPAKAKWAVLLAFSFLYYLSGSAKYLVYLLFSILVTWGTALAIVHFREQGRSPVFLKRLVVLGILLNFGMLGAVKYLDFLAENVNALFHLELNSFGNLLPLGISFYTFQSTGYLLDVYRKREKAEWNPLKYALFVSFFPQLLQGPIGRYRPLAKQLYEPHAFEGRNIARGAERMIWGFFKKMVLADWAAVFADAIFGAPDTYSGLAAAGVLLYTLELYADFSGGMDVVIGIAELFGIHLDENFRRPFFAVSITDFWHRWHITLGTWMKDYVFYPVTLSGWMGKFGKWAKKKFGRKTGRTLPICLANLIVFFVVGVWHGAAWKYIVYGMYNGVIIAFSGLMADRYRTWKQKLHITGKEKGWHVFTVVRTFILVVLSNFFDRADTVGQALYMMRLSVTRFSPAQLLTIAAGRDGTAFTPWALLILALGTGILFWVGVLEERGCDVREALAGRGVFVTAAVYFGLLLAIGFFGCTAAARGFIYAQF